VTVADTVIVPDEAIVALFTAVDDFFVDADANEDNDITVVCVLERLAVLDTLEEPDAEPDSKLDGEDVSVLV